MFFSAHRHTLPLLLCFALQQKTCMVLFEQFLLNRINFWEPGAERLFAEQRRVFWILCVHEAIRREQFSCPNCLSWRAQPVNPKIADLHSPQLKLHKPAFFSTGIGCFGQLQFKIDHRHEKLWGLLFKYLTRAVHIELLFNINTDSFLMTPSEWKASRVAI